MNRFRYKDTLVLDDDWLRFEVPMPPQRFRYTGRQIATIYDSHICQAGIPDIDTVYCAHIQHAPNIDSYQPALYVPSQHHAIVVIDHRFALARHAKAWIADRVRELIIARRHPWPGSHRSPLLSNPA
ncbi:hypothetical protein EVC62_07670 [Salinicola endophyticus]|uniref:Uncharacterized protein n=1 Tax=Salinicola endophyticus TaxID=1949083 RepID=A0ABY8FNC8_9GAMM|nr:hypothetical protein [Salinicola endophyticus]WFF41394.1 hypothetical protein EVC62_07670 [Salinicola endophyticus]